MDAKPAPPERPGEPGQAPPSPRADAQDGSADEAFGPLALKRLVKGDGRALIIYRRLES